jgi:ribA/ribD-fused uncharacterized protein
VAEAETMIDKFQGRYRFLSNFYPARVNGYPTVEHAFQAEKTLDGRQRTLIAEAPTAARAKAIGRIVALRDDWDAIKLDVMRELLAEKFEEGSDLADLLLDTDDHDLFEGNTWGDVFWGIDASCRGENWLGRLLMLQRSHLYRQMR